MRFNIKQFIAFTLAVGLGYVFWYLSSGIGFYDTPMSVMTLIMVTYLFFREPFDK